MQLMTPVGLSRVPVAPISLCRDFRRQAAGRGAAVPRAGRAADGCPLTMSVFDCLPTALLQTGLEVQQRPTTSSQDEASAVAPPTVYSIRFTTGYARGAALSEPYCSAINVLIVSESGKAVLQRVSPVNDPQAAAEHMHAICQVVDARSGVDCSLVQPPASASSTSQPRQTKLRFQEGQVDEVSFLAPDLGPIVGILVGTERGTWLLDEVYVSSSRTAHIDRFVCREKLGQRLGEGAVWLVPVPPGALVYGSGDSTVILTKEQASHMRAQDLAEYKDLKSRVLLTHAALAAGGTGVAGMAAGLDAAMPFALGGAAGLMYQWLLQVGVDGTLGKLQQHGGSGGPGTSGAKAAGSSGNALSQVALLTPLSPATHGPRTAAAAAKRKLEEQREKEDYELLEELLPPPGVAGIVHSVAANPTVRLGFVVAVSLVGVSSLHSQGLVTQAIASCAGLQCMVGHVNQEGLWKLLFGLLGFLTYKVALVGASLTPSPATATQVPAGAKSKHYEKNEKY